MKKHKKIIGVVILVALLVGTLIVRYSVDVVAVTTPPACTQQSLTALKDYFGIDASLDFEKMTMTLKASNGIFKATEIRDPRGNITNNISKNAEGYILIDGKELIINGNDNKKFTLNFKGTADVEQDSLTIKLKLIDGGKTKCNSSTYDPGDVEVTIPNTAAINKVNLVENTNYDKICKVIREGNNSGYSKRVSDTIIAMYDNSQAAQNYYKDMVSNCYKEKTAISYSEEALATMIRTAIKTWNYKKVETSSLDEPNSVWSLNFDAIKAKVPANHRFTLDGENIDSSKLSFTQSCNYKANSSTDFSNLDLYKKNAEGKKIYNIDANVDYYYATSTVKGTADYNYTYTSGEKESKSVNVCERTCEEVVEVKYGPPIASKAGLCFEYQIQTTSRVKCNTKVLAPEPEEPNICNPIPYCKTVTGITHQGGSNEEFDACINSCDGGKYTKKCSNKCYNKVYKKKSSANKKLLSDESDPMVEKIANINCDGNYTMTNNGEISWNGSGYARYYCEFEWAKTVRDHGYSRNKYVPVNGFKRRVKGNGTCQDPCHWAGCGTKSYLNKSDAENDYRKRLNSYEKAVDKCMAAATCTTKTANFKISVDYVDKEGAPVKTIEFPTSSGNNLTSSERTAECASNPKVSEDNNIFMAYGGCYESCGSGLQYHTRWSFPGTWINKKTGEISYVKPGNADTWKQYDNKFCIPLNAKNVNSNWWNYYYNHVNSTNTFNSSIQSGKFQEQCLKNSTGQNITNTTTPPTNVDWNIKGEATKFGYYGWNFKFRCFYALNSNPANVGDDPECKNDNPEADYKIRTVDLENLFPNPDGSALPTSGTVGRQPGFNWSEYANNDKNSSYTSLPIAYANKVQDLGYKVYDDEYLDYEFVLTPTLMKKMRVKSSNKNYAKFEGEAVKSSTGIISYSSELFRDGTGVLTNSKGLKIPNSSTIGCNNIENYTSSKCEK